MLQVAFMLAFFTIFWASFLFWGFGVSAVSIVLCILFIIGAGFIIFNAAKAKSAVRALPDDTDSPEDKKEQRRWALIFSIQGGAIGAVCAILGTIGEYNYIVPAIVLIVGVHYFPLGAIYHTRIHFLVGTAVVAISLFCIRALRFEILGLVAIGICAATAAISTIILGIYIIRAAKP